MKKLRKPYALLFFLLIYVIAFLAGYFASKALVGISSPYWLFALIMDVVATLIVWAVGLAIRNPSIYDPYWSVVPPVLILFWIFHYSFTFSLWSGIMFLSVLLWSIRLTYNFIINFDGFVYQDWRYVMLKEKNPKIWFVTNLFGINMMPTLIVLIQLFAAYQILISNQSPSLLFLLGSLVSILAATIQFISDKQMREFRTEHEKKKQVMSDGLWSVSRHPNYFGEVSFWWGLWIMYFGAYQRLDLFFIPPVLMTLLFVFISVPMMENKILISRPEYKDVQAKISMLIPWPQRKYNKDDNEEITG
ncbi:MAG: DUF1295 domain-containing protein [Firmicutes bacterium]|nr:DUF1295 domain-containing protein [Bacillota bacterium]